MDHHLNFISRKAETKQTDKAKASEKIKTATEAFLESGGTIKTYETGEIGVDYGNLNKRQLRLVQVKAL